MTTLITGRQGRSLLAWAAALQGTICIFKNISFVFFNILAFNDILDRFDARTTGINIANLFSLQTHGQLRKLHQDFYGYKF